MKKMSERGMKNLSKHRQTPGKREGGARSAYHAPQLVEFGDLAARTKTNPPLGNKDDGGGKGFKT